MRQHGVRFQPSLSGTLHLSRTNAFFMGGGKALMNAYYRSAEQLGIEVRYEAEVERLELDAGRFVAAHVNGQAGAQRIEWGDLALHHAKPRMSNTQCQATIGRLPKAR
jgi:tricarballylate dehydrogenase